ncbi:MAG: mechanosensitive ion channel family protein [bacterium]|nr:mechanosensitive ion channel family protein [bacterium]
MTLQDIEPVLQFQVYGNPLHLWLAAIAIFLFGSALALYLKNKVSKKLLHFSEKRSLQLEPMIRGFMNATYNYPFQAIGFWAGCQILTLPDNLQSLLGRLLLVALLSQVAIWGDHLIEYFLKKRIEKAQGDNAAEATAYGAIGFFLKASLWIVITLLALDNFGVNINALVAGLGIGSVAIALALQNILGDVFCSVSILLDKPFEVGDFIVLGTQNGVVEKIGIKSTRLRALSGEQLIISNSDLIGSRIQNFKRMNERRVLFTIGVTYDTKDELLREIPGLLRDAINKEPLARFDRAHLKEFGAYSLNFEVVYFVSSREYNIYMDMQERINLEVFAQFKVRGIEFAFPTQTLHLQKSGN